MHLFIYLLCKTNALSVAWISLIFSPYLLMGLMFQTLQLCCLHLHQLNCYHLTLKYWHGFFSPLAGKISAAFKHTWTPASEQVSLDTVDLWALLLSQGSPVSLCLFDPFLHFFPSFASIGTISRVHHQNCGQGLHCFTNAKCVTVF